MQNTKKLLSIINLKKYFPVARDKIFQKGQLFVKANEDISIDIHEGETFGLVGESGCGKSTLGRTVLQLYDQTAGNTMYYGRTLAELAPSYVKNTLRFIKLYFAGYKRKQEKADKLAAVCDAAGDNATFFMHQNSNIAAAEAQTAFLNVVKIAGGFASLANPHEATNLLLRKYDCDIRIFKCNQKIIKIKAAIDYNESSQKNKSKIEEKNAKLNARINLLSKTVSRVEAVRQKLLDEIDELKKRYADDKKFMEYESFLDDGIDLTRLKYSEMRLLRKDIQIIFQDPYSSLNPRMTIGQIIEEGLVTHKFFRHGSEKMKEYILQIMRDCGLQDYMIHRYPHQFSGGQRQRICIARALAVKPKFMVCDECVSALDVSIQSQIINLLQMLKEKENLTYLFISHDLSVVRYISDRIGVMYLGNMVELGDAETIFTDPRHPYTVALLSSIPTTDPADLKKDRIILEGNIPSPIKPPDGCKFHTRCYMACEKCKRIPPPYVEVEKGHFVACHFLEKKIDENGNYLFDVPKTEKKNLRIQNVKDDAESMETTEEA